MKKNGLFSCLLTICLIANAGSSVSQDPNVLLQKSSRQFFIENKGQWHPDVLYLTRMGGLDVWITKYGVNYTFYKIEKVPNALKKEDNMPRGKFDHEDLENSILLGHRVLFELQNHNPNPAREGKYKQEGYYNYLIGNDPSKHATYVGLYKEAVIKNAYNGIDIRYYFDRGYLRYDYIVQPGADPSQIKFKLKGQYDAYSKDGNKLVFTTRFGEVQMAELKTYQQTKTVASRFVQQGDTWSIAVADYDKTKTLTIDPLIYSTYIGGGGDDRGTSVAVDGSGNAYITGYVQSYDYDITPGVFQSSHGGATLDAFVTKLNNSGTGLIYSTFIGGSGEDAAYSISIDASGNAFITGATSSTDYDVTTGVFQTTHDGGFFDVFVTKLNTTGTNLIYSTLIGGNGDDRGNSVAIDNSGNAYVTGITSSADYDISSGVIQSSYGGGTYDVFVTKLNSAGTSLVYSTLLGGSNEDKGNSIAVDASGNAYITGYTTSSDYDITAGVYQPSFGGGFWSDVFVTKLNSAGTALMYSTFLGGSNEDKGNSIAVDASGNAYITGFTQSTNFDITPGVFQTTHSNGGSSFDGFVTKIDNTGSNLLYSTYFGGNNYDYPNSIAIDLFGNAYITGNTVSSNFDITAGAFQTNNSSSGAFPDVFFTKINSSGSILLYSTLIGGFLDDTGSSVAIDASGNAYISGFTKSSDFDTTSGAFQVSHAGVDWDVFVTKLDLSGTTSINEVLTNQQFFQIFPNPSNGTFTIQSEKGGVFELTDITGRIINTYNIKDKFYTINEELPAGMYFIREKESGAVQKLIIE